MSPATAKNSSVLNTSIIVTISVMKEYGPTAVDNTTMPTSLTTIAVISNIATKCLKIQAKENAQV